MADRPARGRDAGGDDVVAVDHRRGAEDDEQIVAGPVQLGKRGTDGSGVVGDALSRR